MPRLSVTIPLSALVKLLAYLSEVLKHCDCDKCKAIKGDIWWALTDEIWKYGD